MLFFDGFVLTEALGTGSAVSQPRLDAQMGNLEDCSGCTASQTWLELAPGVHVLSTSDGETMPPVSLATVFAQISEPQLASLPLWGARLVQAPIHKPLGRRFLLAALELDFKNRADASTRSGELHF